MRTWIAFLFGLLLTGQVKSQWTELDGPYGGRVKTFTYNGISGQLYIGTAGNGIYTSTNGGNHWFTINNGLPNDNTINKIKIYKNNLFACTHNNGLYKSTDSGNNWYSLGLTNKFLYSIAFKDSMILAGAKDSLYKSYNNGQSWIGFAGHGSNNPIYDVRIIDTIICIGTEIGGVFISTDWGLNWMPRNNGLSSLNIRSLEYKDSVFYCGTFGKGVFQSSDFGITWHSIKSNFNEYITSMAFANSNHYVSTYNNRCFQRSISDSTWDNSLFNSLDTKLTYEIYIFNNDRYVATETGIFKSHVQDTSWIDKNYGIKSFRVNDLMIDSQKLLIGTDRGIFVSTNNGNAWSQKNKNLPSTNLNIMSILNQDTSLYAGFYGEGLYTTGSNFAWYRINSPISHINEIIKNDSLLILTTELQGIYSWNSINWIPRNNGITDLRVRCILLTPDTWYAGTASDGVFKSTDQGQNWYEWNESLTVRNIADFALTDSFLFVGTVGGGVFCYSEQENKWQRRSVGTGNTIYKMSGYENNLFAGTENGFFFSTNNGLNWLQRNEGISGYVTTIYIYHDSLIIGTNKGFLYSKPLSDFVISVQENINFPKTSMLSPNYPNPFNPTTQIRYTLPVGGKVSLKIYNTLGQEVQTLVHQNQTAGEYTIQWNGKDFMDRAVSSGVYLYRLQIGDRIKTKKMMLIK